MIAPEIVEEIKYRNDIVDVISSYVTLKRAGSNMNGLCPFHSEKTPSFTVFSGTRSFHCFGCGAGGDVITFIMRMENLEYPDALHFLAKRAGITIPEESAEGQGGVSRRRILDMNKEAARFFHAELMKSPEALAYLEKRKLPMPLVRHFGLGYAPKDFGTLTKTLSRAGYTDEEMIAGNLCGRSQKTGRPYDAFRGRLMFPIIDPAGEVIAFGGRVLDDSLPKYLNSSDTPAFKKSRNLYALNFAKNACSKQMILCEGYMDVIALHGAGFPFAVATLGTAITPEQARIMKRYTPSVIISYDSDDAGQRAAERAFQLLGEAGLEARILKVENAKDPDEYIKKFGAEAFSRLLEKSRTRFEFRYDLILHQNPMDTTEGKVRALSQITELIGQYPSRVEQDLYIKKVSSEMQIPYESLRADVDRFMKKREKTTQKEQMQKVILETEGYGDRINPDAIRNKRAANAEETLLGVLMLFPERMKEYRTSDAFLPPDAFFTAFNRRLYESILSFEDGQFDIGLLGETFTVEEMGRITGMMSRREGLATNDLSVLRDAAAILREEKNKSLDLESLIAGKRAKHQKENEAE